MEKYIYLIALLPYIPLWLYFFTIGTKRVRKEMVFMSTLFTVPGLAGNYFWWYADWWAPPSLLNSALTPEHGLWGFLFGGISSVAYESIFRKTLQKRDQPPSQMFGIFFLMSLALLSCSFMFSILKLNSFTATSISFIIISVWMLHARKDLIRSALYSGALTLLISLSFYILVYTMSPEWPIITYKFEYLSGLSIYAFPIEEFIFWFIFGFGIGPMYEYIKGWGFK